MSRLRSAASGRALAPRAGSAVRHAGNVRGLRLRGVRHRANHAARRDRGSRPGSTRPPTTRTGCRTTRRCGRSPRSSSALRYRRALKAPPLGALRAERPGRLLDVGSGRGDLGVVLREHGWDVTGLEPSEDACEEARERGVHSVRGTLTTTAGRAAGRIRRRRLPALARARGRARRRPRRRTRPAPRRRPAPRLAAELRLLAAPPVRRALVSPRPAPAPHALLRRRGSSCLLAAAGLHAARGRDVDEHRRAAGEPPVPGVRPPPVRPRAREVRRDRGQPRARSGQRAHERARRRRRHPDRGCGEARRRRASAPVDPARRAADAAVRPDRRQAGRCVREVPRPTRSSSHRSHVSHVRGGRDRGRRRGRPHRRCARDAAELAQAPLRGPERRRRRRATARRAGSSRSSCPTSRSERGFRSRCRARSRWRARATSTSSSRPRRRSRRTSSGSPSHRRGLPWIAELRDGWTFEPPRAPWPSRAQRRLDAALERKVARRANAIDRGDRADRRRPPGAPRRAAPVLITNGFDPGGRSPTRRSRRAPRPRAGTRSSTRAAWRRRGSTPVPLLEALRRLQRDVARARRAPRGRLRGAALVRTGAELLRRRRPRRPRQGRRLARAAARARAPARRRHAARRHRGRRAGAASPPARSSSTSPRGGRFSSSARARRRPASSLDAGAGTATSASDPAADRERPAPAARRTRRRWTVETTCSSAIPTRGWSSDWRL